MSRLANDRVTSGRSSLVGSLLKANELLLQFSSRRRELTTAELSQATGFPRPTVHRIMATLTEMGWAERSRSGAWHLGPSLFRLGSLAGDSFDLRHTVRPHLAHLASSTGDSSYLFVPLGPRVLCLDRVLGPGSIKLSMIDPGQTLPRLRGAAPKVLEAFKNGTDGELPDVDDTLRVELEEVKRDGYALNIEQLAPGICAVGAPIFDDSGKAMAAISLGGLRSRFSDDRIPSVGSQVRDSAYEISLLLGYRGPWPWPRPTPSD